MKEKQNNACGICGQPFSVIIGRKDGAEKLCSRCLIANYPALKVLAKEL